MGSETCTVVHHTIRTNEGWNSLGERNEREEGEEDTPNRRGYTYFAVRSLVTYYTNRPQLCGVVIILILARAIRRLAGIIRFHIDRHDGGAPGEDQ